MIEANRSLTLAASNAKNASRRNCAIFVANRGFALSQSRSLIMQSLLSQGWRVIAICAHDNFVEQLATLGVEFREVRFTRGGLALSSDLHALHQLNRYYAELQPALIHQFHAKP